MSKWQILAELFGIVIKYGPQAQTIIATAETYIQSGNWTGLASYLTSLLATPPLAVTAADIATAKSHLAKLAA